MRGVRLGHGGLRAFRPLLWALLALLAWDASGLDLWVSRAFGGATGFPLRHDRLLLALHEAGRLGAGCVLALLLFNLWRPLPFARGLSRPERGVWLLTTLVSLAAIAWLKQHSNTSCPWSLAAFGGSAPQVAHWLFGVSDGGPGHCFPSGHASSAFSWWVGYGLLRPAHPRAARVWLALTLAAGLLATGVQLVRGAHFLSHSLWAAWLCWAMAWAACEGLRRWQGLRPARGSAVAVS